MRQKTLGSHRFRLATFLVAAATAFFLVAETVVVPTRIEAEVFEHLEIFFHRLVQRGEIVTDHEGAGAGHEDHTLGIAQVYGAAARDHNFLARQN